MKKMIFTLIAFTPILFSCQTEPDDTLPPIEINDSIYISQIATLDTLFESGLDTSQSTTYQYDAAKRITHIRFGEYFPGYPGADQTDDYYYFYNGNDTLPYKMEYVFSNRQMEPRIYETTFLFYNEQGIITKDSVIKEYENHQYVSTLVSLYKKIAEGHYRVEHRLAKDGNEYTGYEIRRFTLSAGNVIESIDTVYSAEPNVSVPVTRELSAYDNHPNPVVRVMLRYPYTSGGHFALNDLSRNNKIHSDLSYGSPDEPFFERYLEDYEFEYRKDGYPLVRREKTNLEPSVIDKYIYTKL